MAKSREDHGPNISATDISDERTFGYTDQAVDNAAELAKLLGE